MQWGKNHGIGPEGHSTATSAPRLMAPGNCFFLLHKVNEFIRATNLEKQVVKRKQQNVLFCLDGVNWSHIIAGNVTRLSSCQGARFPPISFPGGKKKREKEVNMSTSSVFCSHRLGVVGAHDHLLVILLPDFSKQLPHSFLRGSNACNPH